MSAGPAAAANPIVSVGGGGYGESIQVGTPLSGSITSGPTPVVALPASGGGPFTAQLANVNIPGVASLGLLTASTTGALGAGGFAQSSAQVANVDLLTGTVGATAVSSSCQADGNGTSGSSSIVGGQAAGIPLAANPPPNTQIPIPLVGTLTLNEQSASQVGGTRSITVNAVHLHLTGLLTGDVIIAQSRCVARN
jgi:hypothetical protein